MAAGVTLNDVPVPLPGCQSYVVAPLAVSVTAVPGQILFCDAVTAIEPAAITVTVTELVFEQPLLFVPVTV